MAWGTRGRAVVLAAVVAILPVGGWARGSPLPPAALDRLRAAEERLAQPRATAARLRAAAGRGSLADLLSSLGARGETVQARPAATRLGVPPPVADLLAAIDGARRTVERARARTDLDPFVVAADATRTQVAMARAVDAGDEDALDRFRRFGQAVARRTALDAIEGAALDVARAIDRAMPALRTMGAGARGGAGPCAIAEIESLLCIAGDGADEHRGAYALTVDTGGDDRYTGSAGAGAACDGCQAVAVVADLAGDDTYDAGEGLGAGAGTLGIGMVLDAAGNDTYRAGVGQGAGLLGVGLLADLAGSDSYLVGAHSQDSAPQIYGQGGAIFGTGVLADGGIEDDTYEMDVSGTSGIGTAAITAAGGQASAVFGAAALIDGGGTDLLEQRVTSGEGAATISGQGAVGAGVAYLLTGAGDTSYRQAATGTETFTSFFGQGQAGLDSTAMLEDLGGNDVYAIEGASATTTTGAFDESCGCVRAEYAQQVAGSFVWAQGFGISFGAGIAGALLDATGDDSYAIRLRARTDVVAESELPGGGIARVLEAPGLQITGQGMTGLDAGAFGVLVDASGNDSYEASAVTEAHARASGAPAVAEAQGGSVLVDAQGAGTHGLLADLGGADRYTAVARSVAETSPTPERARDGYAILQAHGAYVGGALVDAGGGPDRFVEEPTVGAQLGRYGEGGVYGGYWLNPYAYVYEYVDANAHPVSPAFYLVLSGEGVAPAGVPKSFTRLAFTPAGMTGGTNAVPVILTDQNGAPIPGARILFELEAMGPCPAPGALICPTAGATTAHTPVFRTHGTTDGAGTATAVFDASDLPPGDYTLVAVYSGDETQRFAVATLDGSLA